MKVGNTINGLTVTDVKRVNKLNLIQFLKEVDSYLQQGYRIDVNSARQVGLVLMADVYKAEEAVKSVQPQPKVETVNEEETKAEDVKVESVAEQPKEKSVEAETAVVEEAPKKTTTRSKKTAQ